MLLSLPSQVVEVLLRAVEPNVAEATEKPLGGRRQRRRSCTIAASGMLQKKCRCSSMEARGLCTSQAQPRQPQDAPAGYEANVHS